jgi:hypothetical protein
MTRTKEVDEFGNVSYTIRDGERIVGRIYKMNAGSYRPYLLDESYGPNGSIKAGMEWLARYTR